MSRPLTTKEQEAIDQAMVDVYNVDPTRVTSNRAIHALTNRYVMIEQSGGSNYGNMTLAELYELLMEIVEENIDIFLPSRPVQTAPV